MSASVSDLARKNAPHFATHLDGSISNADTTITLDEVTGLPLDTGVTLTIDPGLATAETVTGVVDSGTSRIVNLVRGLDGTSAQGHNSGANVAGYFTANLWNDLISLVTTSLKQDGTIKAAALAATWPIGSVYFSVTSANPATTLGFGTWVATAVGQFIVGVDTGQTEFNTVEKTGGEKTHALTVAELAAHHHTIGFSPGNNGAGTPGVLATQGTSSTTSDTGSGTAHNNLPPYTTMYVWKRTA